jgi:hypothetical protein
MGSSCSMHGQDEKLKFWLEGLKQRDHLEHLSIDRRIILKWILM